MLLASTPFAARSPCIAGEEGLIGFPPGNNTYAFDWAYLMGAKVHSASWGGWSIEHHHGYDEDTASYDFHAHSRGDSLVLIAASNDGANWGYGSIQPSSQSKNTIAVGSTRMSSHQIPEWARLMAKPVAQSMREGFCSSNG